MTLAEQWKQEGFENGEKKGFKNGEKEGKKEGKTETVEKLLQLKFRGQKYPDLLQFLPKELDLIAEQILFCDKIEDVFEGVPKASST